MRCSRCQQIVLSLARTCPACGIDLTDLASFLPASDVRVGPAAGRPALERFVGIDVGAETIKVVELLREAGGMRCGRRQIVEHGKEPGRCLLEILRDWDWHSVQGAAVTGRMSRSIHLPRVPAKQAQSRAYRFLMDNEPATLVSIGSHGFSVLELRPHGVEVFRENSRCSQGTGNFLRQLIERFSLSLEAACELCVDVKNPAPLSGRCPVILKTDMTHLANKGEDRARILAGLFDAVSENVLVLIKSGISPKRTVLLGGVTRSRRIRNSFQRALEPSGATLLPLEGDDPLFFEALGSALVAAESPGHRKVPALNQLLRPQAEAKLEKLPPLSAALSRVHRLPRPPLPGVNGDPLDLILGFDIGSTGSKVVAMKAASQEVIWEGYLRTAGDPVGAAQSLVRQFVASPAARGRVRALGVTGSGREIVGSLMATCYGAAAVFILNEIAAHAAGAQHYDPRVDTIFEIGGQDAKYIRLADGRVIDCAMNEACSAGTGSFIEEQGRKFSGIEDVQQLGKTALAAPYGVSLGQHCSVFMAEIIDESVANGVPQDSIMAGLYDSIVQNYLHRVKGSRSVGQVIFCQGMPFASDALAAAVARQTGSQVIVPPNPGTVGALGIALLTRRETSWGQQTALDLNRFLETRLEQKDTFVCKSAVGCGGGGNKCRIDRIRTQVASQRQQFTWGGGCSLYDKGTRRQKLPNLAPDPFREREALTQEVIRPFVQARGRRTVALADEFMLKGLFPFFAAFLSELGLKLLVLDSPDHQALRRGIQEANVSFCAPMQLFHGLAGAMADLNPDYVFWPMIRHLPRVADEPNAVTCPIVQASPDLLKWDLGARVSGKVISPVVNIGPENLDSRSFLEACRQIAGQLRLPAQSWRRAHEIAKQVQLDFDRRCLEIGGRALAFCAQHKVPPIILLGRAYTIYNQVLNSNVPAIVREQGAMAIPVDCYPVAATVPCFDQMYWGYGQRILRAAHQIRRTAGVYSVYCSNYSCGPDSFTLHFYSYIMEGKPFAIIETDGHAGDAGTKTRIEAFLHCVAEDRRSPSDPKLSHDFHQVQPPPDTVAAIRQRGDHLLIPWMGSGSATLAACLRGIGISSESLPLPDRETLRIGRRYTSGKECLPMCITLGSLVKRMQNEPDSQRRFAYIMPRTHGPCRLGIYNLLNRITLERLGWKDRVSIWAPAETGYFADTPPAFAILVFAGFMASDLLQEAVMDVRPAENHSGAAQEIYDHYREKLVQLLERENLLRHSLTKALGQVVTGRLFGVTRLLQEAGRELARVRRNVALPTVLVTGEIYVRCDAFSNDFLIDKLEARGIRCRLSPFNEFLEYADFFNRLEGQPLGFSEHLSTFIQKRIRQVTYQSLARILKWPLRTSVKQTLEASAPYLRQDLVGEAVLTLGSPLHEWRHGYIDAVVSTGPLECMPNKIAEAQFFHMAEKEGLLNLTLAMNGDPLDPEIIDNFAFEVHSRFQRKHAGRPPKAQPEANHASHPQPPQEKDPRSDEAAVSHPARTPAQR